ncbi:hypothetical protein BDA99DRAFT_534386 [Phascolomyces articulosus]|uniref:Uncharacterized protein n=1 Tax=Phascolomyces articulosus TaxID=60185 RepID=A0AAD5PHA0_9FUNG|nr:hypothetical protein BDA99DRAFT_534386 [Phascolomyces articulosus]
MATQLTLPRHMLQMPVQLTSATTTIASLSSQSPQGEIEMYLILHQVQQSICIYQIFVEFMWLLFMNYSIFVQNIVLMTQFVLSNIITTRNSRRKTHNLAYLLGENVQYDEFLDQLWKCKPDFSVL